MAWITFNPQGDGVGVDETPSHVIELFQISEATDTEWTELHDRGRPLFLDHGAVFAVWADNEEIEKEGNLQLAAEAAQREGKEASA